MGAERIVAAERILWVDWIGAAVIGVVTLVLCEWLSAIGGLPLQVLLVVGSANLVYALYSFSLCMLPNRSLRLFEALVLANLTWSLICIGLLVGNWSMVSVPGILHLGGEALYVGLLALVEWRNRERLSQGLIGRSRGSDCLQSTRRQSIRNIN